MTAKPSWLEGFFIYFKPGRTRQVYFTLVLLVIRINPPLKTIILPFYI
jgi:hypothetical protein